MAEQSRRGTTFGHHDHGDRRVDSEAPTPPMPASIRRRLDPPPTPAESPQALRASHPGHQRISHAELPPLRENAEEERLPPAPTGPSEPPGDKALKRWSQRWGAATAVIVGACTVFGGGAAVGAGVFRRSDPEAAKEAARVEAQWRTNVETRLHIIETSISSSNAQLQNEIAEMRKAIAGLKDGATQLNVQAHSRTNNER